MQSKQNQYRCRDRFAYFLGKHSALDHADGYLLLRCKHSESETHRKLTGVGNELILENLFRLSSIHQNIIVRIPLIPQLNDDDENLKKTAVLISKCSGVQGIELLKYNHLSSGKNAALGKEFQAFGQPQSDEEMERKKSVIAQVLPKNKFVL